MMVAHRTLKEARPQLEGLRVLVVEDEYMVAVLLEDFLEELGCEVLGPATTVSRACELIAEEPPDFALLDVNLSPGTSAPVAKALELAGIPFIYVTGYDDLSMLPEELRNHPVLQKPVSPRTFSAALTRMARQLDHI